MHCNFRFLYMSTETYQLSRWPIFTTDNCETQTSCDFIGRKGRKGENKSPRELWIWHTSWPLNQPLQVKAKYNEKPKNCSVQVKSVTQHTWCTNKAKRTEWVKSASWVSFPWWHSMIWVKWKNWEYWEFPYICMVKTNQLSQEVFSPPPAVCPPGSCWLFRLLVCEVLMGTYWGAEWIYWDNWWPDWWQQCSSVPAS